MLTPCPRCSVGLTGGPTCGACGLALTGPTALTLWQVDQRIAGVDGQIATLRSQRQELWSEHVRLVVELSKGAPVTVRAFDESPLPPVPAPPMPPSWAVDATRVSWTPPPTMRPRQEWTPRRVQNALLTIGALLLVVAGAIFTAVSWQHLGAAVRGTILLSLTAAAALGARTLARRGLTATAEAIGAVCIGLGVFDAYAFHALVLPDVADTSYWAAATAVLAVAAAGLSRLTGVRVPAIAAALLSLLPLVILSPEQSDPAGRAALLSLDALFASGCLAALRSTAAPGQAATDLRTCWSIGGTLLWVLGFLIPASFVLDGLGGRSLTASLVALTLTTAAAGLAAWSEGARTFPNGKPSAPLLSGAATLSLICGLALPFETQLDVTWWALILIGAALAVLLGSFVLQGIWRNGPAVTAVVAAALAGSSELPSVFSTMWGQIDWVEAPWTGGTAVAGVSTKGATLAIAQQWAGPANLLCLIACAAVAGVAGLLAGRRLLGGAAAGLLLTLAALVAAPQLGGSYLLGLSVDVGIVALAAGVALLGSRADIVARLATGVAVATGALVACWSLAVPSASAGVAIALVLVLAAAAVAGAPYRPVWSGVAVLAGGLAAAALAHVGGTPQPALGVATAGVALAVTAGLAIASRWSAPSANHDGLEIAAVVVAGAALLLGSTDGGWGSWTLLVVAAAGLLSTVRLVRRPGLPASAALGLAAVTLLPFAQQLAAGPAASACLALAAVSVTAGCLLARSSAGHPVAVVLALGSLAQGAAAIDLAANAHHLLTLTLTLLCLMSAAVAAIPDSRLAGAGVHLGVRATSTGLCAGLLLAAVASGSWDRGLEAPVIGLVVALVAAALAAAATQLKDRQPDSTVVEVVAALGAVGALRVAADRPVLAGWVLAVAGLTVLVSATRPERRSWWPAGALLISSATWVWLGVGGVHEPEPYTDPIALVALYVGYTRRRLQPSTPSLTAYGPGLSGLLVPSLAFALAGSGLTRPLLLAAVATAVVVVGAQHRLRAPLLFGTTTLVLTSLRLLAPYEQLVPRWLEVGTAGALLLTLGATYEQRRRDLGLLRARYDALL